MPTTKLTQEDRDAMATILEIAAARVRAGDLEVVKAEGCGITTRVFDPVSKKTEYFLLGGTTTKLELVDVKQRDDENARLKTYKQERPEARIKR